MKRIQFSSESVWSAVMEPTDMFVIGRLHRVRPRGRLAGGAATDFFLFLDFFLNLRSSW